MITPHSRRFARFVVGGGVNTGVTWALFLVLSRFLPAIGAYTVTYVFGIGLAYVINSRLVFKSDIGLNTAWRYPLVYLAQYVYGLVVVDLLAEQVGVEKTYVIAIVTITSLPMTYFLSKMLLTPRVKDHVTVFE